MFRHNGVCSRHQMARQNYKSEVVRKDCYQEDPEEKAGSDVIHAKNANNITKQSLTWTN